jgi:hypothetical protein
MNVNPIIGRRLFVDGMVRPVFGDGDAQYVIGLDGHTRVYGEWLRRGDETADPPLVVTAENWPQ